MSNIFQGYRIIKNFPKDYPFYKKLFANIIFLVTGIIIHPRTNHLRNQELRKIKFKLKRGDIVLVGHLDSLYSALLNEAVTHSTLYTGKRRFIHSNHNGVSYLSLHKLLTQANSLVILRVPKHVKRRRRIIHKAIKYAKKQYGKPYNWYFQKKSKCFFCTELVNESYRQAGYKTGLGSYKKIHKLRQRITEKVTQVNGILHPTEFINGNFKIIFLSHNIELKNKKLQLIKSIN